MLKIEGQKFQEPEFTAKTQCSKQKDKIFKTLNSKLQTGVPDFRSQNTQLKTGVPTRFYNTKLKAQKSITQISEPRN
jgi:hypothetical protein